MKQKSEPPANKKLILKLHKEWCRINGYRPQAPPATSLKLQASSFKLQAPRKRHNYKIKRN